MSGWQLLTTNLLITVYTKTAKKSILFSNETSNRPMSPFNENKKRTQQWFQACGIQVPLGETKFGFIRSISQNNKKSNTL